MNNLKKRMELEQHLRSQPTTCQKLAHMLNVSYDQVVRYVRKLRDAKLAHVHDWAEGADGRYTAQVIAWGTGVDAKRPPADTAATRMARTRANRRNTSC